MGQGQTLRRKLWGDHGTVNNCWYLPKVVKVKAGELGHLCLRLIVGRDTKARTTIASKQAVDEVAK